MKLAISLLLVLALTSCTFMGYKWFTPMRPMDYVLGGSHLLIREQDWLQTRKIAKNPEDWHEVGPVLSSIGGPHPSTGQVNAYFAVAEVLWWASLWACPREWRLYYGIGSDIGASAAVLNNYKIGLGSGLK